MEYLSRRKVDGGYSRRWKGPVSEKSSRLIRWLGILTGSAFVGLSLYRAAVVGWVHFNAIGPLALENPVIAGIMLLKQGANIYSSAVYADFPFYIQMYPPAYYYLVAALPEWPDDPYLTGRLVSGLFMVAAGLTVFGVSRRKDLIPTAGLLFAFFVAVYPVANNTLLARQDPMALFFAAGSIVLLLRRGDRKWMVMASALFAVVALTSKQSYIAAPLAAGVYLGLTDRRALGTYLTAFVSLSLVFVVGAHLAWGSGFWWSTLQTLPAEFDLRRNQRMLEWMAQQAAYVAFVGIASLLVVHRLAAGAGPIQRRLVDLPLLYLAFTTIVCMATLPKAGSSLNYFFEPTLAGVLFCQHQLSRIDRHSLHTRWAPAMALIFLVALLLDVQRRPRSPAFRTGDGEEQARTELAAMQADLLALPVARDGSLPANVFVHPSLRNHLPKLGILPVLPDDYLYSILIGDGRLPSDIFADAARAERFDVVVLPVELPSEQIPGLAEEFFETLDAHYVEVLHGLHRYLVPRSAAYGDR